MTAKVPPSIRFVSTYILRNAEALKNSENQENYHSDIRQSHVKNSSQADLARGNFTKIGNSPCLNYSNYYRSECQEKQSPSPSCKSGEIYGVPGITSIVPSQPAETTYNGMSFRSESSFPKDSVTGSSSVPPFVLSDCGETPSSKEFSTQASAASAEHFINIEKRFMDEITQFEFLSEFIQHALKGFFKDGSLETCFVIFVDFWSRFLKHNSHLAKSFLLAHDHLFLPAKQTEIHEMRIVTSHDQLKILRHLQRWLQKKINVSISRLNYRLLFNFFSEPENSSLLYCVINRIMFDITPSSDTLPTGVPSRTQKTYVEPFRSQDLECGGPRHDSVDDSITSKFEIETHSGHSSNGIPWGLLSGGFNKVEHLETHMEIPWYFDDDKDALAVINGEITKPINPNLSLPFPSESEWAINAWHEYNVERTSRMMCVQPCDTFPSVLSFDLDCVTDELTVVKLSHWSSSPWLLAARQSGVIGLWDIQNLLKPTNDNKASEQTEETTSKNLEEDEELLDQKESKQSKDCSLPQLLISHDRSVTALAFLPPTLSGNVASYASQRESHCLSASADGTMRLWSLHRACAVANYSAHQVPLWSVDVSQFGNFFVSGGTDALACMFTFSRQYPLRIFTGHLSDVQVVKCSPNTLLMATGSFDSSVKLWDIRTANALHTLKYYPSVITHLAFSPNGRLICSSADKDSSSILVVWDIAIPKPLATIYLPQQVGQTTSLAFSYGSHTLVVGCSAGVVVVISVNDMASLSYTDKKQPYEIRCETDSEEDSSVLRLIPLGQRFPADIIFTPENVVALCSISMTNTYWIPTL